MCDRIAMAAAMMAAAVIAAVVIAVMGAAASARARQKRKNMEAAIGTSAGKTKESMHHVASVGG